ncbi:MAG: hypothetical protein KDA91_01510 [Planctomycetaceae bacterium]|nr:hypothetical protein [Planctomycetaceae bacterium]
MVKRFESRYRQIQRIREQHEDAAKTQLAARNSELIDAQQKEKAQEHRLQEVLRNVSSQMLFGVSGGFLGSLLKEVEVHEQAVAECRKLRIDAERESEFAAAVLKAATVELKTVNELVNREKAEHRIDMFRKEDIELQEQASQAWQRKRNEATV